MPIPNESLAEHLKAWKRVVATAEEEGNKAKPSEKEGWALAKKAAEGMVEELQALVKAERAASKTFFAARKKQPVLKLVSND